MSSSSDSASQRESLRGYVVAGGRSSRMGQDKALLSFRGATLIEHAIETLHGVTDDVRILCGRTRRYEGLDVPVVVDDICGAGPLGGLHAALLDASASGVGRLAWLGVDLPLVPRTVLTTLFKGLEDADVAFARTERGLEPLCGAFRTAPCLDAVRRALVGGRLKLTDALDGLILQSLDLPGPMFVNVNTPGEYETLTRASLHLDR